MPDRLARSGSTPESPHQFKKGQCVRCGVSLKYADPDICRPRPLGSDGEIRK